VNRQGTERTKERRGEPFGTAENAESAEEEKRKERPFGAAKECFGRLGANSGREEKRVIPRFFVSSR
jgi:hypothetical protein